MFNFEKQRPVSDAECPQESNGAICFLHVVTSGARSAERVYF